MTTQQKKINAAKMALKRIKRGMCVGLGTGSTTNEFINLLGQEKQLLKTLRYTSSSIQTEIFAKKYSIICEDIDQFDHLDVTVDGADEVSRRGDMIKGGGGALLREKMLASISKDYLIIVDDTKMVEYLGHFPLPIEIMNFSPNTTINLLKKAFKACHLDPEIVMRLNSDSSKVITDGGNIILDCHCGKILDSNLLKEKIEEIPNVITSGFFLNMLNSVFVGDQEGSTEVFFE
ncbi:MAG: ribose 5-phosphate isomerase A [Rhizobiales bacterium TMED28]|nr:ribose 5-phosphate isomerase A [Rhodobiaceae bacterium]OUT83414.1 MAG: ribose 5-phosphate isomerase A [Rhizobiales bacterium TMED28]